MTETLSLEQSLDDVHLSAVRKQEEKNCNTCGKPHVGVKSCTLYPSPLLEYAGNLPEIWTNIIAQADGQTLSSLVEVNKAWFNEAIGLRWHSPVADALRFKHMPKKGFKGPDRVDFYAKLVRQLRYTPKTDTDNQSKGYIRLRKSRTIPELPNLRSVHFLSYSLCARSVTQLEAIFRPTLRHVTISDFVAGRIMHPRGASWFDVMIERCPLLESISLGEDLGISREQFHYFVCRMIHLQTVKLERGSERFIIDHIRPTLKGLKVGHMWMMEHGAWDNLSPLHALEYLEITVGDGPITRDQLRRLGGMKRLKHLYMWPASGPGRTCCRVTAAELISFIEELPELRDFRLWLDFDFFRYEKAVEAAYNVPGMYPQFDCVQTRKSYLEYLGKIADVETEEAGKEAEEC